jgi:L-threonylcarbamoyladenylate synthase
MKRWSCSQAAVSERGADADTARYLLIEQPTAANIARAAELLRQGDLVAFPTETVYGLGADAANPEAVKKIFIAKGRPQDHPVIVHIAEASQLQQWASDVPEAAHVLAARFWPGPLTLVLKRAPNVSDAVTGGQDTVGVRVPSHPVAQQLLRAFDGGIAGPSANRFGRVSPTSAVHVMQEFRKGDQSAQEQVGMILDGGASAVGIESTILDLSRALPVLLRPGAIGAAEIAAALGVAIETAGGAADKTQPRAPGMLESHYAPDTPLILLTHQALLRELARTEGAGIAVLAFNPPPAILPGERWITASTDASAYAHDLYANLRVLDTLGCARILVEQPPDDASWTAVNDRLRRSQTAT